MQDEVARSDQITCGDSHYSQEHEAPVERHEINLKDGKDLLQNSQCFSAAPGACCWRLAELSATEKRCFTEL